MLEYDAVGNRLNQKRSDNSASTAYDYLTNSNRLDQLGTTTIELDAAGNTVNDGARQYQYNAINRLSQVTNSQTGSQATYTYNLQGQRVRKQVSTGEDSRYIYGQLGELLGEYSADGQRIREYIYNTQENVAELLAQIDAQGIIYYIHTDHLNTPRLISNSNQAIVWRWQTDNAFGDNAPTEDADGDGDKIVLHHRFPGQYFDGETGLHYNYFRYYDPSTGRYIQSDRIGLGDGTNTYGYVHQNPLIYYDTNGLDANHIGLGINIPFIGGVEFGVVLFDGTFAGATSNGGNFDVGVYGTVLGNYAGYTSGKIAINAGQTLGCRSNFDGLDAQSTIGLGPVGVSHSGIADSDWTNDGVSIDIGVTLGYEVQTTVTGSLTIGDIARGVASAFYDGGPWHGDPGCECQQ